MVESVCERSSVDLQCCGGFIHIVSKARKSIESLKTACKTGVEKNARSAFRGEARRP